ncbi:MAG: diacylglycerol kinase family lipid kinase [Gammaproteobacteria bacterium]|nr:diacylglycerol kinase family lipid kinase [Gammaproteobacteria bacterium]MDH5653660.1 diacylglycerol kinase family lipid kinase [Gammaproteobacteria bacterium]
MKTRIILNPSAGAGRAGERLNRVRAVFENAWPGCEWVESNSAEHVTELAAEAARAGYARVIAVGGDGTAHFAANGLVGSRTAFGILPAGTGNDIAVAMGLPKDIEAAANLLVQEHIRPFDVIKAGDRYYYCVLGLGMDTLALNYINSSRMRRGRWLYTQSALRAMFRYRPQHISVNGEKINYAGKVMLLAVTNTASYAGGFRLTPQARVDDGVMDYCIFPKMSVPKLLYTFSKVLSAGHEKMPAVIMGTATKLRVESSEPMPLTLDGELTDMYTPVDISIMPGAIQAMGGVQ